MHKFSTKDELYSEIRWPLFQRTAASPKMYRFTLCNDVAQRPITNSRTENIISRGRAHIYNSCPRRFVRTHIHNTHTHVYASASRQQLNTPSNCYIWNIGRHLSPNCVLLCLTVNEMKAKLRPTTMATVSSHTTIAMHRNATTFFIFFAWTTIFIIDETENKLWIIKQINQFITNEATTN